MTLNTTRPGAAGIRQQIARAAHLYAQEVLHILGLATITELQTLSRPQGTRAPAPRQLDTLARKRIGGTKPVACPVPGCNSPGVRRHMNFCRAHADLPKRERLRLRAAQRSASR